jgi:hypothetical protein
LERKPSNGASETRKFTIQALTDKSTEAQKKRLNDLLSETSADDFEYFPYAINTVRKGDKYIFATTEVGDRDVIAGGICFTDESPSCAMLESTKFCLNMEDLNQRFGMPSLSSCNVSYVETVDVVPTFRRFGLAAQMLLFAERVVEPVSGYLSLLTQKDNTRMQTAARKAGYFYAQCLQIGQL